MRPFRISNFGFRIWPRGMFSVALALVLLAAPLPYLGQQPAKVYRIGWLGITTIGVETDSHHCPTRGDLSMLAAALAGNSYSHRLPSGTARAILG